MIRLGTAHPTCDRCGQPLRIEIQGEFDPDTPGDLLQIAFKLPARHTCRPTPDGDGGDVIDLRATPTPEADAP